MKILLFSLLLVSAFAASFAQTPVLKWQRALGGTGFETISSVQQAIGGGYILAGGASSTDGDVTGNHGGGDMWIVKLNDTGAIIWQKSLGGSGDDQASCIQNTADGGYIAAGANKSADGDITHNNGNQDVWIVKLSNTGAIQWQKSLGGYSIDVAFYVQQAFDHGYILAGASHSNEVDVSGHHGTALNFDYWVVKLDSTGTIQWQRSLGGSKDDMAYCVRQTTDSGYIVAGHSQSADGDVTGHHDSTDIWIVKLTKTGSIQWEQSYGGSSRDEGYSIRQTSDGGYIATGYTWSNDVDVSGNHGTADVWVIKLSSTGALQWQKTYGGSAGDWAYSIEQVPDGGYVVGCTSISSDGDVTGQKGGGDFWAIKLSATGSLLWQKCIGGSSGDGAYDMHQTADGNFILAGSTWSNDGDVTGKHGGPGLAGDGWVAKLNLHTAGVPDPGTAQNIFIVPNPTTGPISIQGVNNITLLVYNTLGQLVRSATYTNNISIAELPSGLYFVRVFDEFGNLVVQEKIVKE